MSVSRHPSLDDPNAWVPYRYHPTEVGAIIFIALFSLTTCFHCFQIVKNRTWSFIPLVVGGICEVIGYAGRVLSTSNLWALGPFIIQSILLLIAPAFFAASIYIILSRIILLVDGEPMSLVSRKWLTKIFVCGDVLSLLLQSAGGGIQAMATLSALHTGEDIIIVGLFVQVAFFCVFIVVASIFHTRLLKRRSDSPTLHEVPWRKHLRALYVGSALILARSVFRVIEYLMGNDGYLLRHEVFLYVFDAVPMLLVMLLFNWIHPSEVTRLIDMRKSANDVELEE